MSPLITKYFVILRTKYNFPSRKGKLKKRELFSICKYIHTYKICARPQVGCTTTYPRIRCNSRTHRIGFFQFSPLSRHSLAIIRRIKISCYKKKRKKKQKTNGIYPSWLLDFFNFRNCRSSVIEAFEENAFSDAETKNMKSTERNRGRKFR